MSRYGETPVDVDDLEAFVPGVRFETKAEVDVAEDAALTAVLANVLGAIDEGDLNVRDLLDRGTLQDLRRSAFEGIWTWAGQQRRLETSIGVPPAWIAEQLAATHEDLKAMLDSGMPARELAMTAHWRMVRVHPFVDGNGRITRLYADAILFALSETIFDWQAGDAYYAALRAADASFSVDELLRLVGELSPEELNGHS